MNQKELVRKRNKNKAKINRQDRKYVNKLNIHPQNSDKHERKKFDLCLELEREGKKYITEARFKDKDLRADIYVLDDDELYEIETSKQDILSRKDKYPEQKTWVYPLWDENTEVTRLSKLEK